MLRSSLFAVVVVFVVAVVSTTGVFAQPTPPTLAENTNDEDLLELIRNTISPKEFQPLSGFTCDFAYSGGYYNPQFSLYTGENCNSQRYFAPMYVQYVAKNFLLLATLGFKPYVDVPHYLPYFMRYNETWVRRTSTPINEVYTDDTFAYRGPAADVVQHWEGVMPNGDEVYVRYRNPTWFGFFKKPNGDVFYNRGSLEVTYDKFNKVSSATFQTLVADYSDTPDQYVGAVDFVLSPSVSAPTSLFVRNNSNSRANIVPFVYNLTRAAPNSFDGDWHGNYGECLITVSFTARTYVMIIHSCDGPRGYYNGIFSHNSTHMIFESAYATDELYLQSKLKSVCPFTITDLANGYLDTTQRMKILFEGKTAYLYKISRPMGLVASYVTIEADIFTFSLSEFQNAMSLATLVPNSHLVVADKKLNVDNSSWIDVTFVVTESAEFGPDLEISAEEYYAMATKATKIGDYKVIKFNQFTYPLDRVKSHYQSFKAQRSPSVSSSAAFVQASWAMALICVACIVGLFF